MWSKEEQSAYHKAYYQRNREKILVKVKAYQEQNKEEIAASYRAYYQAHRAEILVKVKAYREKQKRQQKVGGTSVQTSPRVP